MKVATLLQLVKELVDIVELLAPKGKKGVTQREKVASIKQQIDADK